MHTDGGVSQTLRCKVENKNPLFKNMKRQRIYRDNVFDKPFTLYLTVKSLQKKYHKNDK